MKNVIRFNHESAILDTTQGNQLFLDLCSSVQHSLAAVVPAGATLSSNIKLFGYYIFSCRPG